MRLEPLQASAIALGCVSNWRKERALKASFGPCWASGAAAYIGHGASEYSLGNRLPWNTWRR
jgi:hypothetical protein